MAKTVLAIASLALLLALSLSCSDAPAAVRLATEAAYPPYNFLNEDGEIDGLERELGDELCRPGIAGTTGTVWQHTAIDIASAYAGSEPHVTPRSLSVSRARSLGWTALAVNNSIHMTLIAHHTISTPHYYRLVIRSYRDRTTEAVTERRRVDKFPEDIQRRAQGKLMILNNAKDLNDLRVPPGNRLEALSGDRSGQHSIRVNDQWRICLVWSEGNAYQVEIVDYH